jgi:hypothetical protein
MSEVCDATASLPAFVIRHSVIRHCLPSFVIPHSVIRHCLLSFVIRSFVIFLLSDHPIDRHFQVLDGSVLHDDRDRRRAVKAARLGGVQQPSELVLGLLPLIRFRRSVLCTNHAFTLSKCAANFSNYFSRIFLPRFQASGASTARFFGTGPEVQAKSA